jgi:hypothetical protein
MASLLLVYKTGENIQPYEVIVSTTGAGTHEMPLQARLTLGCPCTVALTICLVRSSSKVSVNRFPSIWKRELDNALGLGQANRQQAIPSIVLSASTKPTQLLPSLGGNQFTTAVSRGMRVNFSAWFSGRKSALSFLSEMESCNDNARVPTLCCLCQAPSSLVLLFLDISAVWAL